MADRLISARWTHSKGWADRRRGKLFTSTCLLPAALYMLASRQLTNRQTEIADRAHADRKNICRTEENWRRSTCISGGELLHADRRRIADADRQINADRKHVDRQKLAERGQMQIEYMPTGRK
jgi:hypothetical protein